MDLETRDGDRQDGGCNHEPSNFLRGRQSLVPACRRPCLMIPDRAAQPFHRHLQETSSQNMYKEQRMISVLDCQRTLKCNVSRISGNLPHFDKDLLPASVRA